LSVKIRLKRMGSKKRPFYRIIATDSRMPRDGRFIETLGYYNPMTKPSDVKINEDLFFKWMERGARPTDNTERILRNAGVMKKWSLLKGGVSRDELETKYNEIKSSETPPMDPAEREKKRAAKAAADAKAEESAETAAEAAGDAAQPAESTPEPEGAEEKQVAAESAEPEPSSSGEEPGADEESEKK
jgi:small subunit ribosomal protein S16